MRLPDGTTGASALQPKLAAGMEHCTRNRTGCKAGLSTSLDNEVSALSPVAWHGRNATHPAMAARIVSFRERRISFPSEKNSKLSRAVERHKRNALKTQACRSLSRVYKVSFRTHWAGNACLALG